MWKTMPIGVGGASLTMVAEPCRRKAEEHRQLHGDEENAADSVGAIFDSLAELSHFKAIDGDYMDVQLQGEEDHACSIDDAKSLESPFNFVSLHELAI